MNQPKMIKLADLLELQKSMQPSEESRMKNYVYGATLQQNTEMQPNRFNMGSGGTIEGKGMIQTDHPENKRYQVGMELGQEPNLFEDGSMQDDLLGRELQTLEDLSKMASRLRQAGYAQSDINEYVIGWMQPSEQMGVGYAMKVRSADPKNDPLEM